MGKPAAERILMKQEMMDGSDHMQNTYTLLQTDNYASTSSLSFLQIVLLTPTQQCQSTEVMMTKI